MRSFTWGMAVCSIGFVVGCGPPKPLSTLVNEIETNEVRVHSERVGKTVEYVGTLSEKRVDQRQMTEVQGQNQPFGRWEAEGRTVDRAVVIAVIADGGGVAECQLGEHADARLKDIKTGARVYFRGVLRSWRKTEEGIVSLLDECWVGPE